MTVPRRSIEATAESLLQGIEARDEAAMRTLFRQEAPRLKAVAWRITGSEMLAEDALQDVFLRLWNGQERHDPRRAPARPWLLTLVRFRALELARRAGRETPGLVLPDAPDDAPDPLARLTMSDAGTALATCLERLEPVRRGLIRAAFLGGRSHAELARDFALPLGTVKTLIRRGLLALRKCLEP